MPDFSAKILKNHNTGPWFTRTAKTDRFLEKKTDRKDCYYLLTDAKNGPFLAVRVNPAL
jgi:hypothetical protein